MSVIPPRGASAYPAGRGLGPALYAFAWWGLVAPVYFKLAAEAPPWEQICQRVVWSLPIFAFFLWRGEGFGELRRVFADRRLLARLALSAAVVSLNWLVFIWGIASGRLLEISLGYYINPLISVLLGYGLLGERPHRRQWLAVTVAGLGTLNQTILVGHFPWLSLLMAGTFAYYGLLRKTVPVRPVTGLMVETLLLFGPSLAGILLLAGLGRGAFLAGGPAISGLLLLAGLVSALPLVAFIHAARRLPLWELGLCQYLAPTLTFLLAVFAYGEPFALSHLLTFACVWTALAIFMLDALATGRRLARPAGRDAGTSRG